MVFGGDVRSGEDVREKGGEGREWERCGVEVRMHVETWEEMEKNAVEWELPRAVMAAVGRIRAGKKGRREKMAAGPTWR